MPNDVTVDLFPKRSHDTLHRRVPKLANGSAARANSVVMMFHASDAVLRSAIKNGKLAESTGVHQVANRTIHRRPAHSRKLSTQLLGGECVAYLFYSTRHRRSRRGSSQSAIVERID